jgi:hypothetical protein
MAASAGFPNGRNGWKADIASADVNHSLIVLRSVSFCGPAEATARFRRAIRRALNHLRRVSAWVRNTRDNADEAAKHQ